MTTTSETSAATGAAPAPRPAEPTARLAVPATRTVRTRSGSRYRIDGRRVRKLPATLAESREAHRVRRDFILVDVRGDRLRYTDGERLFISSPIVTTRAEAA